MSCDLLTKCRTCLCDSHIFHQLYDYVDANYKILEMLDVIVPQIDIKTSSNYSSLVCQSCVDKLVAGYKFQQLCIETNKRLHDLMHFSLFETVPKLGKILVPTEASFKTKIEIEDDACLECEIKTEELEETSDNDNNVGPCYNTDNDTDSSNEKLSVLKERKAQKSSKSDEGDRPSKNNRRHGQFPCSESGKDVEKLKSLINETELDMEKVSTYIVKEETKLTPQIFADRMDELGDNAECFNYDDSDHNSENKEFTKPGAKHIKNMDFIDTGKRKNGGSLHSNTRPEGFKCPDCPRRFATQKSLSSHRIIHTRNKAEATYPCLVCPICDKEFGNTISFKHHKRTHRGKGPFLCTECGRSFEDTYHLRLHKDRHRDLRNFKCPECPLRFNNHPDLKVHTQTHTNGKPHVCDICSSRFKLLRSLRKHKVLHSEERPFKCDQCSKKFVFTYHLRRHMITHTVETPHKCKFCERAYKKKWELTKHLRTHVGENTYMCDLCQMAFKKHFEWKQHQWEHKMAQKLTQRHQPIHNHNQQIIIADQNHHLTIEIPNHQQISLVDQQLPTIVEQTSAAE